MTGGPLLEILVKRPESVGGAPWASPCSPMHLGVDFWVKNNNSFLA